MNGRSEVVAQYSETRTYEVLAADLQGFGVEAAFGLMSDDTALFVVALEAVGIRFFGVRHENNAIVMAEGYAAAAGRVGVAVIGRGPGAANCINAAIHSSRTGAAVLIVTGLSPHGSVAINEMGPDYKHADTGKIFQAAGLQTYTATSAAAARAVLATAYYTAAKGGAVVLQLPVNVQLGPAHTWETEPVNKIAPGAPPRASARPSAVAAATAMLDASRQAIIVAGYGGFRAGAKDTLVRLAEKIGALLITSLRAKDLLRGSPYDLGVAGSFSHSIARRYLAQVDCALVVGASLNLLTSSFGEFIPSVPLIQIDADRTHIGRYCYADIALIGDAKNVVEQLLLAARDRSLEDKPFHAPEILEEIAAFRHLNDFKESSREQSIDMRSLALELDRLLPVDRDVIFDMGNFFAIAPYISVLSPDCLRYTGDFGSIGLGLGTALGVAAAKRGRSTVLFIGDGSLLMSLGELETMAREDLPLIVIVLNDNAYGAERHFLELRGQPIGKSVFPAIDFAPIAQSFGIESRSVRSYAELVGLSGMFASLNTPLLIDCKINPNIAAPFLSEFARLEGH